MSDKDILYAGDEITAAITTKKLHTTDHHAAGWFIVNLRERFVEDAAKYDSIEKLWFQCHWPTDRVREILKDCDVEEVFINATREECYEHLEHDDTRPDKDEWKAVIDAWFEEHGEPAGKEDKYQMSKFWKFIDKTRTTEDGEVHQVRILRLDGPIDTEIWWGDEVTPETFREELEAVPGDIELWINSPGGDVFAAVQIYNMLMEHKGHITVMIDALAASAATIVAMAGADVFMTPGAMMMIHNPATIAFGDHNNMQKAIDILDEVKESIINAYQIKTGLSRAKLGKLMEDETWMNARRAVELGFADKIAYADGEKDTAPDAADFSAKAYIASVTNKLIKAFQSVPETTHEPVPEPENSVDARPFYERLEAMKNKF